MTWNIWNIPHPIPRAIVAWLSMLVAAPCAAVGMVLLALIFTVVGAARGIRDEFNGFINAADWLDLLKIWWRAASGKEAV